jgi:hypothetical protein
MVVRGECRTLLVMIKSASKAELNPLHLPLPGRVVPCRDKTTTTVGLCPYLWCHPSTFIFIRTYVSMCIADVNGHSAN